MTVSKVLTERELAVTLGLTYSTVRGMRLKEKCPHFKVGHRIFYRLESILLWLDQQEKISEHISEENAEYGTLRVIQ